MSLQTLGSCFLFLLVPFFQIPSGQNTSTTLSSTSIERQIGPGQSQVFQVVAEQDEYVQIVVDQHGIDVIIVVSTPTGQEIGQFDSPNGSEGPENVSFVANSSGSYNIAVTPLRGEDVRPGKFEIRIVERRHATDDELAASHNLEGLKAKGIALLADLVQTIDQIRLRQTRIKVQLQAAELLWNSDEKLARKLSTDATTEVIDLLASIDTSDGDSYETYTTAMQLRQQVVQALGRHDPEMALNFLRSSRVTTPPNGKKRQEMEESHLELALASEVLRNDPKTAFQLAESTLKTSTPPEIFQTILQLRSKYPELSAKLTDQVISKIENAKLISDPQLAQLATNLLNASRRSREVAMQQSVSPDQNKPLLTDDQYRTLVQKAVSEALSTSNDMTARNASQNLLYTLKSMGSSIDAVVPGSSASIDRKMAQYSSQTDPNALTWQKYQNLVNGQPTDAAANSIKDAPPEMREQLYGQLSQREAQQGNLARARQLIMDNISTPMQRQQWLQNIDQQAIYKAANEGRLQEALRLISVIPSPRRRYEILTSVINFIGPGQKKATAINLLEQAHSMIATTAKAENQQQFMALLAVARVFAKLDSKRAFEIVDPLVDQLNELTQAARTLNGFGQEFFQNDELNMQNGNNVANNAATLLNAIGELGKYDFEHAKTSADRLELTELRVGAYLDIARSAIGENTRSVNGTNITSLPRVVNVQR